MTFLISSLLILQVLLIWRALCLVDGLVSDGLG
ncbi:Uncharacterised protein [Vibrio mimicus]|nr:Uncharacterised protein [Vibrio mimicus]